MQVTNERRAAVFTGLLSALCFSVSPVFVKAGLGDIPSPAIGLLVGVLVAMVLEIILSLANRTPWRFPSRRFTAFEVVAGVAFGIGAGLRYRALQLLPVATVSTAVRVTVPVVLILGRLLVRRPEDRVGWRTWVGAALIVAGAMLV